MTTSEDHASQPSPASDSGEAERKAYSDRASSDPSFRKYWGDLNIAVFGYGKVRVYIKEEGFKASFEGTVGAAAAMAGGYHGALETDNIARVYRATHHFQVTNQAAAIQVFFQDSERNYLGAFVAAGLGPVIGIPVCGGTGSWTRD